MIERMIELIISSQTVCVCVCAVYWHACVRVFVGESQSESLHMCIRVRPGAMSQHICVCVCVRHSSAHISNTCGGCPASSHPVCHQLFLSPHQQI